MFNVRPAYLLLRSKLSIPLFGRVGERRRFYDSLSRTFGSVLFVKRTSLAACALADQAWLSIVNVALALALIRTGDKRQYGLYVLLLSIVYLFQGVQNALFLSPLATVLPRTAPSLQATVASGAYAFQTVFAVFAFALCLAGLLLYASISVDTGLDVSLAVACSAALFGSIAREGVRATEYAQRQVGRALAGDVTYGVTALAIVGYLFSQNTLTAHGVLFAMGAAGTVPTLALVARLRRPWSFRFNSELWRDFWLCGRWALLGVFLSWVGLNSYSYISGWTLGLEAVADLNAARLLVMPAALGIAAWSALFRPRFSAWYSGGERARLPEATVRSISFGLVVLVAFAISLHVVFPYLSALLGPEYEGLEAIAMLWSVFFGVTLARTVYMASLMVDADGYRRLTSIAAIGVAVMLPLMALGASAGVVWVVAALISVEAVQAILTRKQARRYWSAKA